MVEEWDLHHSIANMNLHKSHTEHFVLVLTMCEILIFLTFELENLGQGHMVNSNYQPLQKSYLSIFC